MNWKRQRMGSSLTADAKIAASLSPFGSVRSYPAAPGAELGEQMSQLVAQSALYLRPVMFA